MLTKLVRTVLTFAGGVVGYGVYLLLDFLVTLSGHDLQQCRRQCQKRHICAARLNDIPQQIG